MTLIFCIQCDDPKDEDSSGKQVSAKLISSNLSTALRLQSQVTLTNVTGLADSVGLNFSASDTGNTCGFNVWAADSQTSKSGLEGRTYESFDLGDPVSWESLGAGLQGECDSATVSQVESYFMYIDLHLTVGSFAKVIRLYLGQQAPFEAGDLALVDGSDLYWYDQTAGNLVLSTAGRPTNPRTFTLSKEVPWFDNNGTEKIIMHEFRIAVDRNDYQVTKETGHVTIDIDFTNSGISVSDTSSDGSLLSTITLPFLDTSGGDNHLLQSTLTILQDRPPEDEQNQNQQ
jgi:hypothetical protein